MKSLSEMRDEVGELECDTAAFARLANIVEELIVVVEAQQSQIERLRKNLDE
jgi:HAMP domain-containing protein